MPDNITAHNFSVNSDTRAQQMGHKGIVLWFTGLSGSGKSTIAHAVENALVTNGIHTYTLDGDNVRKGLNNNLAFSPEDRKENIRRIAEVSHLMMDAGLVVLSAFVSPYRDDRARVMLTVGAANFLEIYVNTSLEVCEQRDVKGLYAKARKGEIKDFTGISAPYEAPLNPAIDICTEESSINESVEKILAVVMPKIKL